MSKESIASKVDDAAGKARDKGEEIITGVVDTAAKVVTGAVEAVKDTVDGVMPTRVEEAKPDPTFDPWAEPAPEASSVKDPDAPDGTW